MRYLLDTHTLLWALTDPDRLGVNARTVIEEPRSTLIVSAASAWEISTKHRLGRLPHAHVLINAYSAHISRLQATRLPVTEEHALLAGTLPWEHRDPFDRMLAAQALIESAPLITTDTAFASLEGITTLW